MITPNLATRLRAIAESLEAAWGLSWNDPDLLTVKRLLLVKVAVLESQAVSNATDDTSPKDIGTES
jgi:hypothetical protein